MHKEDTDYRKWILYSRCNTSQKDALALFKVIEKGQRYKGYNYQKLKDNSQVVYLISEKDSPVTLKLSEASRKDMLIYLLTHYISDEKTVRSRSKYLQSTNPTVIQSDWPREPYQPLENDQKRASFLEYTELLANAKPLRHSLNFSLLGIFLLQFIILPSYLLDAHLGDNFYIVTFLLIVLIAYLNVFIYSEIFKKAQTYKSILKLTVTFCFLLMFFTSNEIFFISTINEIKKINVLTWVAFTGIMSIGSIFLGLVITAIIYFIRGGKVVGFVKKPAATLNNEKIKYPSVLRRSMAVLIDYIIIGFLVAASILLGTVKILDEKIILWVLLFTLLFYEPLLASYGGGTIGHKLLGLQIKKHKNPGSNISIIAAFGRYIVKTALGLISLFTMSSNPAKRSIHDIISGSVVKLK